MLAKQYRQAKHPVQYASGDALAGVDLSNEDGTLNLQLKLCDIPELAISCRLVHRVAATGYGEPYSSWELSGAATSLVPKGVGRLQWHSPLGNLIQLERQSPAGDYAARNGDAHIVRRDDRMVWIQDSRRRLWIYDQGILVRAVHPVNGTFDFVTEGARIVRIYKKQNDESRLIFEAWYSPAGELKAAKVGEKTVCSCEWTGIGLLKALTDSSGHKLSFTYQGRLVSSIRVDGSAFHDMTWAATPDCQTSLSVWLNYAHLEKMDDWHYDYSTDPSGYHIEAINVRSGEKYTSIYNPNVTNGSIRWKGRWFLRPAPSATVANGNGFR